MTFFNIFICFDSLQEKTLQDEIEQLKEEERKLETYIRKRKVESEKQELLITNLQDDSDHLCKQRDELQDLRKYEFLVIYNYLLPWFVSSRVSFFFPDPCGVKKQISQLKLINLNLNL